MKKSSKKPIIKKRIKPSQKNTQILIWTIALFFSGIVTLYAVQNQQDVRQHASGKLIAQVSACAASNGSCKTIGTCSPGVETDSGPSDCNLSVNTPNGTAGTLTCCTRAIPSPACLGSCPVITPAIQNPVNPPPAQQAPLNPNPMIPSNPVTQPTSPSMAMPSNMNTQPVNPINPIGQNPGNGNVPVPNNGGDNLLATLLKKIQDILNQLLGLQGNINGGGTPSNGNGGDGNQSKHQEQNNKNNGESNNK